MKKIILFHLLIMLIFFACNKEINCKVKNGNEGLIVKEISDDLCWQISEKNFVIRTDSAYKSIVKIDSANCSKPLENIDFSKFTLLGQYADAGGCSVGFLRTVTRNDAEKKYTYEVYANGCGQCDMLGLSNNMVLVEKIPEDYTVEFSIKEN